jgi:hypothetical protein
VPSFHPNNFILQTLTLTGYHRKRPLHCDHFWSNLRPHLSSNHMIHPSQLPRNNPQRHPVAKQKKKWQKNGREFCLRNLFSYLYGFSTCRTILWYGTDALNSLPKQGLLRIFNTIKNPSSSVGFEPANLGSNGNHANHQNTESNLYIIKL